MLNGPLGSKRFRLILWANLVWFLMVFILTGWWGRLLLSQAEKIAELEGKLGWAADLTQSHWHKTQRMLFWESISFFVLLLACTLLLFWFYWRDVKRTRGLQAFFASVTHELRTPLTSIRLQAESISEGLPDDHSQKKWVQRLLEDTLRLEGQVERTLELARLEGGGPVYTQTLQIKPWVDRTLKSWRNDYPEKIEVQAEVEDVLIEADPAAMQVIFRNLLENSLRHSKKEKTLIQISASSKQDGVALLVRDDGQGYEGDGRNLGKIFNKGRGSQGTGVGLYLVRVLMAKMGGWAEFSTSSEQSSGFEVSLWFPEGKMNG